MARGVRSPARWCRRPFGAWSKAYITGRRWDVLAWNEAAEEIFAFGRLSEEDRNTLLLMMTNKKTRKSYGGLG